jgi:hypothetical protein
MTRSIGGPTFAKELSSDEGLRPPVMVNGFVRKTSDANVIEISLGPDTAHGWLRVPVSMIKQATITGRYNYKNSMYDFVTIELNWPDNAEARVFAALLREQGTDQSGLGQVFTQEQQKLVEDQYPPAAVRVVLRLIFVTIMTFREERGWGDGEVAGRFRTAVAWLKKRYPIPEAWESIEARRFATGGVGDGFKMALFETIAAVLDGLVRDGPATSTTADALAEASTFLERYERVAKQLESEGLTPGRTDPPAAAPAILERFEGFVDQVEGDVAFVTLRAENGDVLYGEHPVAKLAERGVGEADRFLCRTVRVGEATRVEIEAIPDEPVPDEEVRAIYQRIDHAIGSGDDGVDF